MSGKMNSKQKRLALLEFHAKIKRKRGQKTREPLMLFPDPDKIRFEGTFAGICVEISDKEQMCELYEKGGYGKGTQSRSAPQAIKGKPQRRQLQNQTMHKEMLVLGLEESFFLAYVLRVLKICDIGGRELAMIDFLAAAKRCTTNFIERLAAYLYLKHRGWVVASGMKFGSHYVIYEKGPRFNHASFMVIVTKSTESATEAIYQRTSLMGRQRVAEATGKDLLILEVTVPPAFDAYSMEEFGNIKITETIVRRFNYNKFSQS